MLISHVLWQKPEIVQEKIIYLYSEKFTKNEVLQTNDNLTHCQPDGPLIKYPHFPCILYTSNAQCLIIFLLKIWLFTWYSWTQYWRNCIGRVWQILMEKYFSNQDPSWSGTQDLQMYLVSLLFTNVPSFTSPMCSMYFTLSCRTLLLVLPTSNNFV